MRVALIFAAAGLLTAAIASGAELRRPWESSAVDVETGILWQAGHSTPLSYRLIPTQLSWRSRATMERAVGQGRLVVRTRVTLFGTWIQQGPESHYVAVDASPSIELWDKRGAWCVFGGAGGGLGFLDSQGVPGAQGQDFTLNWIGRVGVEHVMRGNLHWSAGLMFQHMSNGGQTKPNPGIDAVGFMLGCGWSF
jgi:lipid A 3-O-deacylase